MTNIYDLQKSISNMSDEELHNQLRSIRAERRKTKAKPKAKAKVKAKAKPGGERRAANNKGIKNLKSFAAMLSKEDRLALIKKLEEN